MTSTGRLRGTDDDPADGGHSHNHYDAIVVGGGQAGLAAAHRLALNGEESGKSVLVLEASDHVGGRTRNYDFGARRRDVASDDSYELGGTWISPAHTAVLGLCREVGLDVFDAIMLDVDDDGAGGDGDDDGDDGDIRTTQEMPWYYWGPDYRDEDMRRLKRTVLHMHPKRVEGGDDDDDKKEVPRRVTFRSASEFLSVLDGRTRSELEAVGRKIDSDVRDGLACGGSNCWERAVPGAKWAYLDSRSTGDMFLSERHSSSLDGDNDSGIGASAAPAMLTTPDARSILHNVIHNKNAEEPEAVSYLYNLISFGGCNSSGPDSQYRIRGGTQALPLRIAELLNASTDSRVLLNSPVEVVRVLGGHSGDSGGDWDGDGDDCSYIQVQTEDGRRFTGDAVIVTGSPHAVRRITFSPPLPPVQGELLRVPMGRSMKFAAVYHDGPWWRSRGLQGDVLVSGLPRELSLPITDTRDGEIRGEPILREPILGYCFDLTPYSRRVGVLSCFIEGVGRDYFVGLNRERHEGLIRHFLRLTFEGLLEDDRDRDHDHDHGRVGGKPRPRWEPDEFVVGDWGPDDRFVGGAYTSYFPPGVLSDPERWEAYCQMEKLPNVFLAGADYHAGFGNGYVEGAVRSGQRAADLILGRL